jgi:hypothetical protein
MRMGLVTDSQSAKSRKYREHRFAQWKPGAEKGEQVIKYHK